MKKISICCTSGGYKNVFAQGVLKAFKDRSFRAEAYASCSSSSLIAAYAAMDKIDDLDTSLWEEGYEISQKEGNQSQAMLHSILQLSSEIKKNLWLSKSSRLLISTSRVLTEEAMMLTQTEKAKRMGQKLLIDALRHRTEWRDQHLKLDLFDTANDPSTVAMTEQNLDEVLYATTRMLHAWDIPANIEGVPYLDGSYTASCLIGPMIDLGYKDIIYINTEHDKIMLDLFTAVNDFQPEPGDVKIRTIQPDVNLAEMGVDFYSIKGDGLADVFRHGYEKGIQFLDTYL